MVSNIKLFTKETKDISMEEDDAFIITHFIGRMLRSSD